MPTPPTREIVTLSGELRLVPVVEFEPGRYSRQERPLPGGSGEEVPRDWQHYWEQSLADSGLHLEPLFSGSWFVPISRLTDPHVREEEPDRNGVHRAWHLSPHALANAVLAARKEQEDFARRLIPLLSERFPPEMTHPLASVLSGLGMPEDTDDP